MNAARRLLNMTLIAGRETLPSLSVCLAANRSWFKHGSANQILMMHDHDCRYPWGEPCTCLPGPEIGVAGEDPGCS